MNFSTITRRLYFLAYSNPATASSQVTTVDDVLLMLDKIRKDYREGNAINWGIVEVASGKIAGSCGFTEDLKTGQANWAVFYMKHSEAKD